MKPVSVSIQQILLLTLLLAVTACNEKKPILFFTCTEQGGAQQDVSTNLRVIVDLNEPKVDLNSGTWIYNNTPADTAYGADILSIRQDSRTGDIVMAALRADTPTVLRISPSKGTMYYAYATANGITAIEYKCQ